MKKIVALKELRENVDTYISEVKKGKSFLVVRRSQPVFTISPPDEAELWESVVDFTSIQKHGVSVHEVLKMLRKLNANT